MDLQTIVSNVNAIAHPITNVDSIIKRFANQGQHAFASSKPEGFFWLRQYRYSFTTVNGTQSYSLSPLVDTGKAIVVYDEVNNQEYVPMSMQYMRGQGLDMNSTGQPYIYSMVEFSPVQFQPTAASVLSFVSSNAADTTQTVFVQGLDTNGILVSETVTLTGAVAAATTLSYTRVMTLSKSAKTAGNVTVTSNGGATTNVVWAPKDLFLQHPVISLYPVPSDAHTVYYDFTMLLPDIIDDNDTSLIPAQYHDVIELYATYKTFAHLNNKAQSDSFFALYKERALEIRKADTTPQSVIVLDDFNVQPQANIAQFPGNFPRQ